MSRLAVHFSAFCLSACPWVLADKVTYDEHVLPIFEQACLNCHNPDKAKGGLDLSTYPATMKGGSGGKIVEAGDTGSKLIAVVRQTAEPIMPPEGDALPGDQIKTLEAWITGGLLENSSSKAKKPTKPKFDTALAGDPASRPVGPPPFPSDILLEPATVAPRSSAIHAMATSPWAPLLAVTGQNQVLLYSSLDLELVGILPFPEGEPVSLAFTPNGRYLIIGGGIAGKSGVTVTFDITTGERVLTAAKEFDTVLSADLSPDLSRVVTGSPSKLIKLWNSEDGSRQAAIKKHTDWIMSVDFSNDGILLATGDRNGGVWVWEGTTGNEFHTLRGHQAGISEVRFRADSNILASASEDGSVRFWEMNGGKEVKKIDAHKGGVTTFAWGTDGTFATAGRDKTAKLWKPDFGQQKTIPNLPDIPTSIALDAENKRVFVADYQGLIAAYDTRSGKPLGNVDANPPTIPNRLASLEKEQGAVLKEFDESNAVHQANVTKVREAETRLVENKKAVDQTRKAHQHAKQAHEEHKQLIQATRQKIDRLNQQKAQANQANQKSVSEAKTHERRVQDAKKEVDRLGKLLAGTKEARQAAEKEKDEAKRAATIQKEDQEIQKQSKELAKAEQVLADLRKQATPFLTRRDETQQHLQRVSEEWNREKEALAKHDAALPSLKQAIDQTGKRIKELEKQGPEIQKSIDEAKKERSETGSRLWKARLALNQHAHLVRRWSRAQLLTEILQTRQRISEDQLKSEELAASFASTSKQVEALQVELAEKRQELGAILGQLAAVTDDAKRTELLALESTLNSIIEDLESEMTEVSNQLTNQRGTLDQLLPSIHRLRKELATHQTLYDSRSGTSE